MTIVPTFCIDCGLRTPRATRCKACYLQQQRLRNQKASRQLYRDPVYRAQPKTGICHICKLPGADSRDHVIPISLGGTNLPTNIKPAHKLCNQRKYNRVT